MITISDNNKTYTFNGANVDGYWIQNHQPRDLTVSLNGGVIVLSYSTEEAAKAAYTKIDTEMRNPPAMKIKVVEPKPTEGTKV